jgi:predicted nucleic-acid-binding protein
MIGADTNILVRFLIGDVKEQNQLVNAQLEEGEQFYINATVVTEMTWVLTASYNFTKQELVDAYDSLLESSGFVFFDRNIMTHALAKFIAGSVGFNDCLICEINQDSNLETLTFDKRAAKLDGMKLLT